MSALLPLYLSFFPVETIVPSTSDLIYLLILSSFCTVGMFSLQVEALKRLSAFTVNLSYNLEPVYSIILAMIIFNEAKDLNFAFYIGLALICKRFKRQSPTAPVKLKRLSRNFPDRRLSLQANYKLASAFFQKALRDTVNTAHGASH